MQERHCRSRCHNEGKQKEAGWQGLSLSEGPGEACNVAEFAKIQRSTANLEPSEFSQIQLQR